MALYGKLKEEGFSFACAFVNYHTRKESDLEEQYVRDICKKDGIVCHVKNETFRFEGNFEAKAREYRYSFFGELCKKYHYAGILVGHQEDDLLETYIMQKKKGIIPDWYGLKEEMIYHNIRVIRPLLQFTKQDLKNYCDSNNIQYWIDSTNLEDDHERNRIRHHVVEPMTKGEREVLLSEIEKKNEALTSTRNQAKALLVNDEVNLEEYRKKDEEVRLALLRLLLSFDKSPSKKYLQEMDEVIQKKDNFILLADKKDLVSDNGKFFLVEKRKSYSYEIKNLKEMKKEHFKITKVGKGTERLHVCEEDFPLTIRNYEEGDRIEMFYGHKNLSRFFIDRHIPLYKRRSWPIVLNKNGEIILVPELGCDKRHYAFEAHYCVVQY